ncbi:MULTISPECIES: hypothetical protein [unclassified Streptomyces]|uniref:hypothetical protein n=1 Tax=unclassified Streptomyces TaxID=2593676 RepID=UPI000569CDCA|nr:MULTISPECIES: hypothetical protein [unclassified Streptomyces]MYX37478.1 hypothetical protein [Streptomyces sp. SID8377]
MDSWEGSATLEWWANPSTCLGAFGVRVSVRVTGAEWTSDAVIDPPLTEDDQELFGFLMDLDPVFTLRFDARGTLMVNVVAGDGTGLILTAYEAKAAQPLGSRQVW